MAISGRETNSLNGLANTVPTPSVSEGEHKRTEYLSSFYQARNQFNKYYLRFATSHTNDWEWLETEHFNLLAAAQNCYTAQNYTDLLNFRDALQPYLDLQGHWADSQRLNEWAIDAAKIRGDLQNAARFTHDQADIFHQLGEYRQAAQLYKTSERMYLRLDNKERAIASRHMRALVVRAQGQLAEAEQLCESVIADAHQLGLHTWIAHPLYIRALLARDRGDFQQAHQCIMDSLERLSNGDEFAMMAQCHHFLGELKFLENNLSEARSHLEKSLQLSRSVGILRRVAATQRLLGDVTRAEGNYEEASRLYSEAFELATQMEDQPQRARVLLSQTQLHTTLGQKQKAITLLQNSLALYEKIGDPRNTLAASLLLARLHWQQRQIRLALQQVVNILKITQQTGLLQKNLLLGIWKRWGRW